MNPVYSLSELNLHIRQTMEDSYPDALWVSAEVASFIRNSYSGHCYLELVDGLGQQAKMKAMIWKKTFEIIQSKFEIRTGTYLKAGIQVQFLVKIEFNVQYGLSLIIWDVDPDFTLGEQAKKRALVIRRLEELGLLERNKTRKLDSPVQNIAIISSETAAGLQDFLVHISENEFGFSFNHRLFPATMQGNEAVGSIQKALAQIKDHISDFQAVILIRGGGSVTELQVFDEYDLAASLAEFPLPVFSGIGHHRDETVCDLVAHSRFKTPTAVADWLISNLLQCDALVLDLVQKMAQAISWKVIELEESFSKIHFALSRGFSKNIQNSQNQKNSILTKVNAAFHKAVFSERERFQNVNSKITEGNPIRIFQKGYARVSQGGKLIRSRAMANSTDNFLIQWIDGTLQVKPD